MTLRGGFYAAPEVEHACSYLESHGELMGLNFSLGNAITKAAEMMCVFFEEDTDWVEFRRYLRSTDIHKDWT